MVLMNVVPRTLSSALRGSTDVLLMASRMMVAMSCERATRVRTRHAGRSFQDKKSADRVEKPSGGLLIFLITSTS